ncbi:MAG: 1-deoxy-D-xylulose-5-phosphate synthase [Kiritimatiellae bacterium]|nr:1-deoxy-D-xylulose-5-phosphate synthase [Kiritimatiellia bacterium]
MSSLLEEIRGPEDVRSLPRELLEPLAEEIRARMVATVSRTGGHLASNLGVVELTLALLRSFAPPADKIVWDVGHQTYAWKLLTGRRARFDTLRQPDGLSGFLKRAESPCDAFGAGHAGTAISAALGMATARDARGGAEHVVAVVGDAALGNGLSLEALNNVTAATRRLILILNDNEMSISGSVGALSRHFGRLLASHHYNRWKSRIERTALRLHMSPLRRAYHRTEAAIKSLFVQNVLFENLGLRYVGPIDGHDLNALLDALAIAKDYDRPIVLHVATIKGRGYAPAERAPQRWHGVGSFDAATGELPPHRDGYSEAFGAALTALARHDERIVAITAAMRVGTGLDAFAQAFPKRLYDVGICESHAVVFAAGQAAAGLRPVVALYSTFMQRAVDSVLHDVCLQGLPVVFCLDRAGVVGADGPTHHGLHDLPLLRSFPGLTIMQPRDEAMLARMLVSALRYEGPSVIRYPRDPSPGVPIPDQPEPLSPGTAEVVLQPDPSVPAGGTVWLWALGDMLPLALSAAEHLRARGISLGVVDARFVKPLDLSLLRMQAPVARCFATLENGVMAGGFGSAIQEALAAEGFAVPVRVFGWPDAIVGQGTTDSLRLAHGLTARSIAEAIASACAAWPARRP